MKKSYSFTVCALAALFIIPCFAISYGQAPPTPTITSSKGTSVCEGDTTILSANSAGATGYLWSTGATTPSINVSTKGAYAVTASNASGNSAPASIYINAGMVTPVAIEMQKTFGTGYSEDILSLQQTEDGGYIAAGIINTPGALPGGQHGGYDCYILKIDSDLHFQWKKYFGGSNDEFPYDIRNTSDGGYIIAGYTNSNDGDISGFHGGTGSDYMIIKIDSTGTIQWQKCLGGTGGDDAFSIKQTPDGGYIVAGRSTSNDGDVTGNHGAQDFWVVKLNTSGTIEWQKCYGGSGTEDYKISIILTSGGYIVSGSTYSNNGDVSGNHGNEDYWICKIDLTGTIIWQKCLGGTGQDQSTSILQTPDGGYVASGLSTSNNGDVSGQHGLYDSWTVKLNSTGTIEWQKCNGSTGYDHGESISLTSDGGYIVTGTTSDHNNGDVDGIHGGYDGWIIKLDTDGALQWQKCIGGTSSDFGTSIQQTPDGGYIVGATSGSNNQDVSGNHGGHDYWIVKLGPEGTCPAPSVGLKTTNITATKARFNWYATPCAEGYYIKYRQTGTTAWTWETVLDNTGHKTLTGLMPSTNYEWRVKVRCSASANSISKYSAFQYFTTPALRESESLAQNTITACSIFPNPAPGNFSLSFNSDYNSKGDIEIYNTIGELVYKKGIEINEEENTIEINLTDAPAGVFFLNLKSGNRIYRQKLIKE